MIARGSIAALFGVGSLAAQTGFTSTIGLGSVLVAMLVVILFGVFSLRERRHSGWKDLFDQERARNELLNDEKEEERIARHLVKDELAATRALLEIEKSKPDLTVILDQQRMLWGDLTDLLKAMQETQQQMLTLLTDSDKGVIT